MPAYQPYKPPHPSTFKGEPKALFTVQKDGLQGCIDINGKIEIEPRFEEVRCSVDLLLAFRSQEKWGFVDQAGEVILEPQFSSIAQVGYRPLFSEGFTVVCMNEKCGYIDSTGKYTIEPRFDYAENFSDGFALIQYGAKNFLGYHYRKPITIFIDKSGKDAFPDSAFIPEQSFSEGLGTVAFHSGRGCMDVTGRMVVPIDKNTSCRFSEGLAVATETANGDYGYVDKNGRTVIPFKFRQAGVFSEGLATVMFPNGKYGYIDRSGQTVIPPRFDVADTFYEGRAVVMIGYKKGYIDAAGNEVIPIQFGSAERFVNGLARVSFDDENPPFENKKYGYIDRSGNFVWEPSK